MMASEPFRFEQPPTLDGSEVGSTNSLRNSLNPMSSSALGTGLYKLGLSSELRRSTSNILGKSTEGQQEQQPFLSDQYLGSATAILAGHQQAVNNQQTQQMATLVKMEKSAPKSCPDMDSNVTNPDSHATAPRSSSSHTFSTTGSPTVSSERSTPDPCSDSSSSSQKSFDSNNNRAPNIQGLGNTSTFPMDNQGFNPNNVQNGPPHKRQFLGPQNPPSPNSESSVTSVSGEPRSRNSSLTSEIEDQESVGNGVQITDIQWPQGQLGPHPPPRFHPIGPLPPQYIVRPVNYGPMAGIPLPRNRMEADLDHNENYLSDTYMDSRRTKKLNPLTYQALYHAIQAHHPNIYDKYVLPDHPIADQLDQLPGMIYFLDVAKGCRRPPHVGFSFRSYTDSHYTSVDRSIPVICKVKEWPKSADGKTVWRLYHFYAGNKKRASRKRKRCDADLE